MCFVRIIPRDKVFKTRMAEQHERTVQCRDSKTVTFQHPYRGMVAVVRQEFLTVVNTLHGTVKPPSFRCPDCRQNFGCVVTHAVTLEKSTKIVHDASSNREAKKIIDDLAYHTCILEEDVTQVPVIPKTDASLEY
jgi:hypothetical protein